MVKRIEIDNNTVRPIYNAVTLSMTPGFWYARQIRCIPLMVIALLWPHIAVAELPTLPESFIDTTFSPPSGTVHTVGDGGDFQAALDSAELGDTIVLAAGSTFMGPFTLPDKPTGEGWIYIQSSALESLPEPGSRVGPGDAGNMPTIIGTSAGVNALNTVSGAHHYRFVGIEFRAGDGEYLYNLVQIGDGESSVDDLPHHIFFDRCYIHGDPTEGGRRGIAMNGNVIAVIDSYISTFMDGADSQAVWSYNGEGPFKIVNNYLEATGENVMFGGSDPDIENLVPADIEIRRNTFFKPLEWDGVWGNIKNLLEFKSAERILVEGNWFENNWASGQNGMSLLITPRNQHGNCKWCVTRDITIRYNIWTHVGGGINILGSDNNSETRGTERIHIHDNLFISVLYAEGIGRIFQLLEGNGYPTDLVVEHNTGLTDHTVAICDEGQMGTLEFRDNIFGGGKYGFFGSGTAEGTASLDAFFGSWTYTHNAMIGSSEGSYPDGNFFPSSINDVGFTDVSSDNLRLLESSPYHNAATDGTDLGVRFDELEAAMGLTEVECGDGSCETGENCESCPGDCPTPSGQVCCGGQLYTGDCCGSQDCSDGENCTDYTCGSGDPDAGDPDADVPDADTPDGGDPDGGTPDGGTPDGGTPSGEDDGCGCRQSGSSGSAPLIVLFAAFFAVLRLRS